MFRNTLCSIVLLVPTCASAEVSGVNENLTDKLCQNVGDMTVVIYAMRRESVPLSFFMARESNTALREIIKNVYKAPIAHTDEMANIISASLRTDSEMMCYESPDLFLN
ncbi:MAG: hypothetical protein ACK4HF_03235 [Paracoccaceae bacterium]